ncbi:hypothetical protein FOG48_00851 [Hanseniaspora uvarum]|nr:hypothetical protein FOG48_00851 [Hanseniaspora uvarum]
MSVNTTEEYLVKAINRSKINKKPLVVYLSKNNDLNWINSWINEDVVDLINKRNACILLKIHINEMNIHYQFFKTYMKSLNNNENEMYEEVFSTKDNVLVIIHNNESQYVINDDMDEEEKNEILQAFISDFKDELKVVSSTENENKKDDNDLSTVQRNEYLKAKNEDFLERQRLRKLIELDRLEQKETLNNNENTDTLINEVIIADLKDNIKTKDNNSECKLSIKTPENKNIIRTFDKNDTLDNVRKYLMEEENIKKEFFFHRIIPRVTYKDMDEFKTLEELDLLPRSVLLVEYKCGNQQKELKYFDSKTHNSNGIIRSLMNWWNGDVSLPHEHEKEITEPKKKDDRETYNGNTTNVLDPNKK